MNAQDAEEEMILKAQQFAMKELMDSCPAKTVIGGVLGYGMGGWRYSEYVANIESTLWNVHVLS
jgi:hypothetical protein